MDDRRFFKTDQEIMSGSLNLIPETFQWENYAKGWAGFAGISFLLSLGIRLSSLQFRR